MYIPLEASGYLCFVDKRICLQPGHKELARVV
jgi:hypothetical protein